ncbi:hypothetical protein [Pseudomonas sp. Pseusp97]|uniref:hypothetical protein n=1 Tax=Pseudomonas sp. Pseusp97 TaxID=3243065 RepID=UPI0039A65766
MLHPISWKKQQVEEKEFTTVGTHRHQHQIFNFRESIMKKIEREQLVKSELAGGCCKKKKPAPAPAPCPNPNGGGGGVAP